MTRKILIPAILAMAIGGIATQSISQGVVIERALAQPPNHEAAAWSS